MTVMVDGSPVNPALCHCDNNFIPRVSMIIHLRLQVFRDRSLLVSLLDLLPGIDC